MVRLSPIADLILSLIGTSLPTASVIKARDLPCVSRPLKLETHFHPLTLGLEEDGRLNRPCEGPLVQLVPVFVVKRYRKLPSAIAAVQLEYRESITKGHQTIP
jgi:hypothetical protein